MKIHITDRVPSATPDKHTTDILRDIMENVYEYDSIDYIYILDDGKLMGVVSMRELLSTDGKLGDLMRRDIIASTPEDDPFDIPYLALSHGIKAIPVVDQEGRFRGAVTHDEIIRILKMEADRDILHFGGVFHRVIDQDPGALNMVKSRVPWLVVGVIGGTITAALIGSFEDLLSEFIALASFIPIMVYMSDAVGTQSEALIIRKIAVDPSMRPLIYIRREVMVAAGIGALSSAFAGLMAGLTRMNPSLGLIIFISMFFSVLAAVLISTASPLVFRKLGFDPAVATGPLATILSDFTTTLIYLSVASSLL
ncbi:magnesium transporter [Methanothermobacter sp. K4]|uniref:magnesium transporter n=1 Tax=Methanothermobacter sp. K4 TaxID=2913262 RepID=UPI001EDBEE20|nr:magnesium transporter [Methanothermobacter sp. K4]MCG2828607.1 magnesium transporter [Methanothermobacter sp. K4]